MQNTFRKFLPSLALVLLQLIVIPAANARQDQAVHPLAIHMNQWLNGSREWSTANPGHDPEAPGSFAEFRVRWDWGPLRQQLRGKLFGVRNDGSSVLFWTMFSTYNPVSKTVTYQQIGRNGAYILGEHPVRERPLAFGDIERLDTTMYRADGTEKITRHENVFSADSTHSANVFEQAGNGDWELKNTWSWRLVDEDEVLGREL